MSFPSIVGGKGCAVGGSESIVMGVGVLECTAKKKVVGALVRVQVAQRRVKTRRRPISQ